MQDRSRKNKDINIIATSVVNQATDEARIVKNSAAVALGGLGSLKGGKAGAEKLLPKRRVEIAKKAALAR